MLELIKKYVGKSNRETETHRLREFLQCQILQALSARGYFKNISFLGGTSLRLVHEVRRYSEDLDFSLISKSNDYNFDEMIHCIVRELELKNFVIDCKMKKQKTAVRSCLIKFSQVLYDLELSPLKDQKLAIKFEVDENPPLGFNTELGMTRGEFAILMNHFDKPSLFAGKLHALFSRPYPKGRDYFDLLWFLINGVKPNLELLSNALYQTRRRKKTNLDIIQVEKMLLDLIAKTNFKAVIADLSPFIMDPQNLIYYSKENFTKDIKSWANPPKNHN